MIPTPTSVVFNVSPEIIAQVETSRVDIIAIESDVDDLETAAASFVTGQQVGEYLATLRSTGTLDNDATVTDTTYVSIIESDDLPGDGKTFMLVGIIRYNVSVASGGKLKITVPTNATVRWTNGFLAAGILDIAAGVDLALTGAATDIAIAIRGIVMMGDTAGPVIVSGAMFADVTGDFVALAGSSIVLVAV